MRYTGHGFALPCAAWLAGLAITASASAALWHIEKDIDLYGNLNQNDIPNVGASYCGPAAAVNSFAYLQNAYPGVYNSFLIPAQGADWDGDGDVDFYDDMIGTALTLGSQNYMNTLVPGGTAHDNFIWGKEQYIENQVAGVTTYEAQDYWDWTNHAIPDYVDPIAPTWDFLYWELFDCEDVELLLSWSDGGHYVTLTSFHWNDADDDGIIDIGEDAWIDFMDPWTGQQGFASIWHGGSIIETDYVDGSWISMAVSESPIPGPSVLALLAVSTLCSARRFRRG
jgi:hypothetical protein